MKSLPRSKRPKHMASHGDLLKELRDEYDLTQRDIADIAGYKNTQMISNVERGLCCLPPQAVANIASLYEIDAKQWIIWYLFDCDQKWREKFNEELRRL